MHYYAQGRNGAFELQEPIILGHESAGTIMSIGPDCLRGLKPGISVSLLMLLQGNRVTIEPGIPCWHCPLCMDGRYNLCPDLRFPSSCKQFPHANGTLQTIFNHPEELVHMYSRSVSS